jgi:hypothetical protein
VSKLLLTWGINKGGSYSQDNCELRGCVPDRRNVAAFYAVRGYSDRDGLWALEDEQATRNAIWCCLMSLADTAQPGDVVTVHGSSHGSTLSANGETLHCVCPVDWDWSVEKAITSRDIAMWLAAFKPGVSIRLRLDSCFSGKIVDPGAKRIQPSDSRRSTPRAYPRPEDIDHWAPPANVRRFRDAAIASTADVSYLSACDSTQTAADTQDEQGNPCGAFTNAYLTRVRNQAMWVDAILAQQLDDDLHDAGYEQTPGAEGPAVDKPSVE